MHTIDGNAPSVDFDFLTPKEAAALLRISVSWLAKARMRGEGPPFIEIGRSIRYSKAALQRWVKAQER